MQTITGTLTAGAKVKQTKTGKKVTEFTVAVNDSYRPKVEGGRMQLSTYFECSYWCGPKVAAYLKKGTIVTLDGRISASAWTNREGKAVATLTCTVFKLKILARPIKKHAAFSHLKQHAGNQIAKQAHEGHADDDGPFWAS